MTPTCIFNQKGWQQQGLGFCFQGLQVRAFALEHHCLLSILLQAACVIITPPMAAAMEG